LTKSCEKTSAIGCESCCPISISRLYSSHMIDAKSQRYRIGSSRRRPVSDGLTVNGHRTWLSYCGQSVSHSLS
jgi:hypothetical protein